MNPHEGAPELDDPISRGLRDIDPNDPNGAAKLAELAELHQQELADAEAIMRANEVEATGGVKEPSVDDKTILEWAQRAAKGRTAADAALVDPDGRGGLTTPDDRARMAEDGQQLSVRSSSGGQSGA